MVKPILKKEGSEFMSGAMNTIYRKKNFKIYDAGSDTYIIHNTSMEFSQHHTHIRNFRTCKYIIDLCIHRTVPVHLSDYLIISLLRLTGDNIYRQKLENILSPIGKRKLLENKRGEIDAKRSYTTKRKN